MVGDAVAISPDSLAHVHHWLISSNFFTRVTCTSSAAVKWPAGPQFQIATFPPTHLAAVQYGRAYLQALCNPL